MEIVILVILGLLMFIDAIFDKWGVWHEIEKIASGGNSKFVFDLASCRFCMQFHIAWMLTLMYGAVTGFEWFLIVIPFVVSGLTQIFRRDDI